MFYSIKSSWWIRKMYRQCTWSIPVKEKIIYLSFDDGPHPDITPFVLDELKKYNAKAIFFCIGKNVVSYPSVYKRIIEEGHAIGNHTQHHLNGWKTADKLYLDDIATAKKYIDSNLYRPPYGKIKLFQLKQLALPRFNLQTIMWSVLSGDFDERITKEKCLSNVIKNVTSGSIVVFHDSEKSFDRMQYALKGTLAYFADKGYKFEKIHSGLL
ncbi:MAG: polysaccharide deacetylase family protein [Ferruginibacter sp.]|nr:polysaccharide deacetylase family protein [Ferruginibacter sp.]